MNKIAHFDADPDAVGEKSNINTPADHWYREVLMLCLILALALWPLNRALAQTISATSADVSHLDLPPLEKLIEIALENSPALEFHQAIIRKNEHQLLLSRKRWADGLSFGVSSQYGSYGNSTLEELNLGYQANVSIKFSIFDWRGRSSQIGIFAEELQASVHQKEQLQRAIRKDLIRLYYQLKLAQRLLAIKTETKEAVFLHRQMGERQFLENEISVAEQARITDISAKASIDFETARHDFINAYAQLRELVGTDLSAIGIH